MPLCACGSMVGRCPASGNYLPSGDGLMAMVEGFQLSVGPHSGLTVVAWQLADIGPGDGGFGCLIGSHKGK